jgi:hypothetical protein
MRQETRTAINFPLEIINRLTVAAENLVIKLTKVVKARGYIRHVT